DEKAGVRRTAQASKIGAIGGGRGGRRDPRCVQPPATPHGRQKFPLPSARRALQSYPALDRPPSRAAGEQPRPPASSSQTLVTRSTLGSAGRSFGGLSPNSRGRWT